MNKYLQLKNKHQQMVDAFPMGFAFDSDQLDEGLEYLGVTKDGIVGISGGGFIRKTDTGAYKKMWNRIHTELNAAIDNDNDGTAFIADMFEYELANHEYVVTGDMTDTLEALNLTMAAVANSPALANGLKVGKKRYMDRQRENG